MENTEKKSTNKSSIVYITIIVLQLFVIAWLLYDKNTQKQETLVVIQKMESSTNQKDSVERELKKILTQYEDLKTSNTKINAQLTAEQQKIQQLLAEIRNVKNSNFSKIEEYKQQIETLRAILRSYIVQIDSLNTTNQKLTAENKQVKENFAEAQNKNTDLSKKSDSLQNQVAIASVLKAINLKVTGLNKRDKETNRSSKLDKFKVCLTLAENPVAKRGTKDVIIRISGPDKKILLNDKSGYFKFQKEEIAYSSKRDLTYDGKNVDICIYYANIVELKEGQYIIDVFVDGNQIATTTTTLK